MILSLIFIFNASVYADSSTVVTLGKNLSDEQKNQLKAFEEASGIVIDEDQKKVANEEVVKSGELGEEIGQEEASELIRLVKEEIIDEKVNDPEEIKKIIIDIAARLDINLKIDQIENINGLMQKISKLNLDSDEIKDQLKNIGEKLEETLKDNEEVRSLLQRILDAIVEFFSNLFK